MNNSSILGVKRALVFAAGGSIGAAIAKVQDVDRATCSVSLKPSVR